MSESMHQSLTEQTTRALVGAYAAKGAVPGAGSAVAIAAATAVALLERCAKATEREDLAALVHVERQRLLAAADEDAVALSTLVAAGAGNDRGRTRSALLAACHPPEAIINAVERAAELTAALEEEVPPRLRGELECARLLADVCATAARRIRDVNRAAANALTHGAHESDHAD
jgi:hypothetical protein